MRIAGIFPALLLLTVSNQEALLAQTNRVVTVDPQENLRNALDLDSEIQAKPGWSNRILTGLGAGIIGAGAGYFASQIADSDWDESRGNYSANRGAWAALGGALGFSVGFSFPISNLSGSGGSPLGRGGRDIISAAEIQEVTTATIGEARENITEADLRRGSVSNALELVTLLRPEWLVQRGVTTFADPDTGTIRVYLDNQEFGGIDSLEMIEPGIIESILFLNEARATARFGAGHTSGVIQVITR